MVVDQVNHCILKISKEEGLTPSSLGPSDYNFNF